MAEPTPPPPTPSPGGPDRRALLEAYQNLVRSEQDRRASEAVPEVAAPSGRGFWVTTIVAILGLSALLVTQPAWLFTPPPNEAPTIMDASLRVRMYVEIERIERFRSDSARLPATLTEAGGDSTGLTYRVEDGGYTLTGVNGSRALAYTPDMPRDEFLGDSYRIIRERGRP
jgi:hypothetical protein